MTHPSLADFAIIDILQLIRSENVGPVTFFQLLRRFGSPKAALDALPELAQRGGMKRPLRLASRQAVEREIALTEKFGASFCVYGDAAYPKLLMEINDPPPLIAIRGSAAHWQKKRCIAMVGSRNASANGCTLTRKLARACGELGLTATSGLARGIDTAAHQGALATGTVGVIAGGIDNIYPPENKSLYDELAEKGAIISENPFGANPQARSFPSRNRIIAGMSEGLLVVEAAPKSGSLITARYALEYNREVMAIPGFPLDPRSAGTNGLIKQGALLVESAEDILEALQQAHWNAATSPAQTRLQEPVAPEFTTALTDDAQLENIRSLLLEKLAATPIQLDELARDSHIPIALMQSAVLELELAGQLSRHPGGRIARIYEEEQNQQAALL